MTTPRSYAYAGLGFCLVVAAVTLLAPSPGQTQNPPPTFNVRVSNTPLPVTGTVNASVSGPVQAQQSGTWSVQDADNPARAPYQKALTIFMPAGDSGVDFELDPVPPGKRLVIEYVSLRARSADGQHFYAVIGTKAGGVGSNHTISEFPSFPTQVNGFRVAGGESLRLYADPQTTPFGTVGRSGSVGGVDGILTVSGYYVDL